MTARRKCLIGLVLAGALCSLCAYLPLSFILGENLVCWEAEHLPRFILEDHARFRLPPASQSIAVETASGWSFCVIAVRFEMPPEQLSRFVAGTQVQAVSASTQIDSFLSNYGNNIAKLGFQRFKVQSYLFGSDQNDYFNRQYVFVDTTNMNRYTAYVITDQGFLD